VVRHQAPQGQSFAVATGVRAARGRWIATLDGDGQNDPADIPRLLAARDAAGASAASPGGPLLLAGYRKARSDSWLKRVSSRVANGVRGRLLGDSTPDTGCGLKLFEREAFLALPHFDHMHRFLPALFLRAGGSVISVEVGHRPRTRGRSHYGVMNRLWVGIVDIFGVLWLMKRGPRR
jgi:dolichol-phosphate mannosyltransferase